MEADTPTDITDVRPGGKCYEFAMKENSEARYLGIAGITTAVIGAAVGFSAGWVADWDSAKWGSVSSWVAAAITTVAVLVALRSSHLARTAADKAVATANERAEEERKFRHRRETAVALSEFWAAIMEVREPVVGYIKAAIEYYRSPTGLEVKNQLTGKASQPPNPLPDRHLAATRAFGAIEAKRFNLEIMTVEPTLIEELVILNQAIRNLQEAVARAVASLDDPNPNPNSLTAVNRQIQSLEVRRHRSLQIARKHLLPLEGVAERADVEEERVRAMWNQAAGAPLPVSD